MIYVLKNRVMIITLWYGVLVLVFGFLIMFFKTMEEAIAWADVSENVA
jgi:hypothetical protein